MDRDELIRRRAFDIWCAEGWPKGRDREHWEQARLEIDRKLASDPAGLANAATDQVTPKMSSDGWSEFFLRVPRVSPDYMSERVDPLPEERDFSFWDKGPQQPR